MKEYFTLQAKIPIQMINTSTVGQEHRNPLSCASKVILQMNAKLGCPLWHVTPAHPFWKNKLISVAGITFGRIGKGSYATFVGTYNAQMSKVFSDTKLNKDMGQVTEKSFMEMLMGWMHQFYRENGKRLPQVLVFYREGTNFQNVKPIGEEVQMIEAACKRISEKTNVNFNPIICYMLVNKRAVERMFINNGNSKKFNFVNPEAGTVVYEDLSQDLNVDFHLASVSVNQGSCTPVRFRLAYSKGTIPLEALAELTNEQCYNYPNWQGAVRVPGVLQMANKLSTFFKECIKKELTGKEKEDIKFKCYYL